MVLTDRAEIAEKVALLRSHGFEGSDRVYVHRVFGCNYRLTNLQAAIGLAQCERIDEKVETKRRIYETYRRELRDFDPLTFPGHPSLGGKHLLRMWRCCSREAPGRPVSNWWKS